MFKAKPQNLNNMSNEISMKVTQITNQYSDSNQSKPPNKSLGNQVSLDIDFTPNFSKLGRVEKMDTALDLLAGISTPNTVHNSTF